VETRRGRGEGGGHRPKMFRKLLNHIILTTAKNAKMEVGCLRYPRASTIGSQLQDEDCSHGWQILVT